MVTSYIQVQTKAGAADGAVSLLKSLGQVSLVARTTGLFDVLAHADFESVDEANEVLVKLRALEEVEHASVLFGIRLTDIITPSERMRKVGR